MGYFRQAALAIKFLKIKSNINKLQLKNRDKIIINYNHYLKEGFTMTTTIKIDSSLPILEQGDKLTRAEFEHRYQAMPNVKKAELIEGVVYMSSPVRAKHHGQPHSMIITWLGVYCAATPGIMLCDNTTVRLDLDNEPQPDVLLRIETEYGGQSKISEDDYIEGAPELIVEIASSSVSYDLHNKLNVYRRNRVQEYLVWRVQDQELDWFELQEGKYIQLTSNSTGIIESIIFPGLNLPVAALITGDLATVLEELKRGIATQAHQKFIEELQK